MLHAFLFTQSGIPVLYSGDEIGQKNDYTYHEDPLKWDDSRYLHRGDLNWDEVALRNDLSTREGRIFNALRVLEIVRAKYEVFDNEADTWIVEPYNDHILGIGRYYKGQKLIALFNFSKEDEIAWINESEDYHDIITGESREAKAVALPAYDFVWLMTDFNKPLDLSKADAAPVTAEKPSEPEAAAEEKAAGTKAKKTAAKKPAAKKPAAKKPAARKTKAQKEAEAAEAAADAPAEAEEKKPAAKKRAPRKTKAQKEAEAAAAAEAEAPAEKKTSVLKTKE
jgi:amylosucrase